MIRIAHASVRAYMQMESFKRQELILKKLSNTRAGRWEAGSAGVHVRWGGSKTKEKHVIFCIKVVGHT